MRNGILLSGALLAGAALAAGQARAAKNAATAAGAKGKPNFVIMLLDDSGFSDFGCYGGGIPTPNIDKLASKGVRMSQMYNCARSCPTRSSILTGLYPQQAGIGYMVSGIPKAAKQKLGATAEKFPAYQGYLNNNCVTLAEVLDGAGYFTALSGKWHVGQEHGVTPFTRGFTRSLTCKLGGGFYYDDGREQSLQYLDGVLLDRNDPRLPKGWYATDLYTDYGMKFVDEAIADKKPFMLYLAFTGSHYPLQAPPDEIAAFKGKFDNGWDAIKHDTWQRQMDMNLLGANYAPTPRNPKIPAWNDVDSTQKAKSERIMEIYAAVIAHIDKSVGQMVDHLKQKGVFDNTVIIVLCDNGASAEGPVPFGILDWSNPGGPGSDVHEGSAWAEVSDAPFFLYKRNTHEGGIATPLIVSYPNGIPAKLNGSIARQPGHVIDIMATLVALSGAHYPETFKGNKIIPMQGINLMPIWLGQPAERKDPIYWEHENNIALRDGKWKLVKEEIENRYQLYDMDADRTELHDLSQQEPQVMADMMAKFKAMFAKVGSAWMPFPQNPAGTPTYDYPR